MRPFQEYFSLYRALNVFHVGLGDGRTLNPTVNPSILNPKSLNPKTKTLNPTENISYCAEVWGTVQCRSQFANGPRLHVNVTDSV